MPSRGPIYDLHRFISGTWDQHLDAFLVNMRRGNVPDLYVEFPTLFHNNPLPCHAPYVLWHHALARSVSSMSQRDVGMPGDNSGSFLHQIWHVPVWFEVWALKLNWFGAPRSPQEVASRVMEEICRVFGGHPDHEPEELKFVPDASSALVDIIFEGDKGYHPESEGFTATSMYYWRIDYTFVLDVDTYWHQLDA